MVYQDHPDLLVINTQRKITTFPHPSFFYFIFSLSLSLLTVERHSMQLLLVKGLSWGRNPLKGVSQQVNSVPRLISQKEKPLQPTAKAGTQESHYTALIRNADFGILDSWSLMRGSTAFLVSLAAVFWMSRSTVLGERCVTSKKRLRGRLLHS